MNLRRVLRPRLLGMVVLMLALLGVASYLTMARQEDPSFPYRAGLITVIYPGAVAESVERLVLEPLSDELSQVSEVDFIKATARTGVALVSVMLDDNIYDTDAAWDRLDRLAAGGNRDALMFRTLMQSADFIRPVQTGSP
mgnify:CR=1 FL=1